MCLLDEHHNRKIWPTFEKDCFVPRVAEEAVIPIYLDDTEFVGIPKDVIGIKFSLPADGAIEDAVLDEIVFKLAERIESI